MTRVPWRTVKVGDRLRGADGYTYTVTERIPRGAGYAWFELTRTGRVISREFLLTDLVELEGEPDKTVIVEIELTKVADDLRVDVRHVAAAMVLAGFADSTLEADGDASKSPPDPRAIACPVTYKEAASLASHLSILHGIATPGATQRQMASLREVHEFYHNRGIKPEDQIETGGRVHTHDDALFLSRFAPKDKGGKGK